MQHDPLTVERVAQVAHEGQRTMPADPPPLVCKPRKIESWRIYKIMSEFIAGFDIIRRYGLAVSFFGSARATFEDDVYQHTSELSARLVKRGFAVITGGSAGVMQAANKGAFEAGGASVGLNVELPDVQTYNPYLNEKYSFHHFFVRKVMLTYASEVYVFMPGGYGTLDEFFEIVTLVQTKKLKSVPIVLFGKAYWAPLVDFLTNTLYKRGAIDESDLSLFKVVDSVDEAYEYIMENVSC